MATILIVDDRQINREYLATVLSYAKHSLLEASDGGEALELATAKRPDLIITDILMPTMDGVELVRRLRADPATERIPIVFYTAAYRAAEARAVARSSGVPYVICKPAEPRDTFRTVSEALGVASMPAPAAVPEVVPSIAQDVLREPTADGTRLAALVESGLELASETDPLVLGVTLCRAAQDVVGAGHVALGILNAAGDELSRLVTFGFELETIPALGAPGSPGILGKIVFSKSPIRLHGAEGERALADLPPGHPPIRSFLGVPVVSSTRPIGFLYLCNRLGKEQFEDEDQRVAHTLAAQFAVAQENLMRYHGLEAALHGKAALLKEMHHRVKNSLQIVSGFLSLQRIEVKDRQAVSALLESESRVRAMALTHEMLYRTEDLKRIDFGEYARRLAANIRDAYQGSSGRVVISATADEVHLGLGTAIPAGLILQELATNALKHAFPGGGAGEIRMQVSVAADSLLEIRVADTGKGIQVTPGGGREDGLGMTLVRELVGQIGGTLEIVKGGGTAFVIRFPFEQDRGERGAPAPLPLGASSPTRA